MLVAAVDQVLFLRHHLDLGHERVYDVVERAVGVFDEGLVRIVAPLAVDHKDVLVGAGGKVLLGVREATMRRWRTKEVIEI